MMHFPFPFFGRLLATFLLVFVQTQAWAWTPTHRVTTPRGQILLRPLSERSILFAFEATNAPVSDVAESPMWDPAILDRFRGGSTEELPVGESLPLGSGTLRVFLDPVTGDPALELRHSAGTTASIYRLDFSEGGKGRPRSFRLRAPQVDYLYGLGEHLPPELLGQADGDLLGQVRYSGTDLTSQAGDPKGVYGNAMVPLAGGAVSNALFPVLHLVDATGPDALLFLDNPALSRWDFRSSPWRVELAHGRISGALAWGEESGQLRAAYMQWTGRSPVPPRKAFGMWVSEYGYENWEQLEEKASGLAAAGFPVDGFVLDLQWFGGIIEGSEQSSMGKLTFDTSAFPEPAAKIAGLTRRGLGLLLIEEAYIASGLPEYKDLASRGYLVRSKSDPSQPLTIDESPWWGLGSMLDFTHPEAAGYWHESKRKPLRELGIMGHWTDLGEPEMFRKQVEGKGSRTSYETPLYHNDEEQVAVNNLFAFRWAESIFRGFGGEASPLRPWILGRTGTSGIQRFGTALWSGDIGANWESLRSHYRAQGHLAMSGIDYFGSDVGGFHRQAFQEAPGGYKELYTRWFAAGCLTDIPLRPHVMNLGKKYETSPHLVGHVASNLANLRQRYRLIPYLYSAAHRAWEEGTPLVAPPIAFEQGDKELDRSGSHKWIGADLLARLVLEPQQETVKVTLPPGSWYDFESGRKVSEQGGESLQVPAQLGELRRTPLFARGGAVIPLGSEESSEPVPSRLELVVFPGKQSWEGALVEDDGRSQGYRHGHLARTRLSQTGWTGRYGTLTVDARRGAYAAQLGAERDIVVRVASSQNRMIALVEQQEHEMTRDGEFWLLRLPGRSAGLPTVINFR